MELRDFETFANTRVALSGADVHLRAASTTHPNNGTILASTTTDPNGKWEFTGLAAGQYDVEIIFLGKSRFRKGLSSFSNVLQAGNFVDLLALRNLLVNPYFEYWFRGNGAFTSNGYTADRWSMLLSGGDSLSVSRDGANLYNGLHQYSAGLTYTLVGGAFGTALYQEIKLTTDAYRWIRGQKVTFRAAIKCAAAQSNSIRIALGCDGTGGATVASSYHGNNTNWEELNAVLSVVIPADATLLTVGIYPEKSGTYQVGPTCLMQGTDALLRSLPPDEDISRCRRYYYQLVGNANGGPCTENGYADAGSQDIPHTVYLPTRMAVTPTITKAGTWNVANCGQPTVLDSHMDYGVIKVASTAAGRVAYNMSAAAQTLTFEANPALLPLPLVGLAMMQGAQPNDIVTSLVGIAVGVVGMYLLRPTHRARLLDQSEGP